MTYLRALECDDRVKNFCTMAWLTARPVQATVFPRTTDQTVILSKGEGLNLKICFVFSYLFLSQELLSTKCNITSPQKATDNRKRYKSQRPC